MRVAGPKVLAVNVSGQRVARSVRRVEVAVTAVDGSRFLVSQAYHGFVMEHRSRYVVLSNYAYARSYS
jgi:hypothetical protein